jgi:4-hydroxybenzoate polyprenyltransferase
VKPLVVDLEGSLIKTDLIFEAANALIAHEPRRLVGLARCLLGGRAQARSYLAQSRTIEPASLPYHEELLAWLHHQHTEGRQLILVARSPAQLAEPVFKHLGFFDELLLLDQDDEPRYADLRSLLIRRYGAQGFDFVGSQSADLPVWQAAATGYLVSSDAALIAQLSAQSSVAQVFSVPDSSPYRALLKALRPHQWVKNTLLFVPLLAAQRWDNHVSLLLTVVAFAVFGLTASSVYLINDLIDVGHDRVHPVKKLRPFAAGTLSLAQGWALWPVLLASAFGVAALTLPAAFSAQLAVYFLLTLAYSLLLKKHAIVDVLTLAALYTLRITAGVAALAVPLSFWLLTFSMFIFLSLAFLKRFTELKVARDTGATVNLRGRGYRIEDLELVSSFGVAAGYLAVLVLALYIQDNRTGLLYRSPQLIWLACPLLLFWVSRAWLLAHRGQMNQDPVVFALSDRLSWFIAASFVGIFALARILP